MAAHDTLTWKITYYLAAENITVETIQKKFYRHITYDTMKLKYSASNDSMQVKDNALHRTLLLHAVGFSTASSRIFLVLSTKNSSIRKQFKTLSECY